LHFLVSRRQIVDLYDPLYLSLTLSQTHTCTMIDTDIRIPSPPNHFSFLGLPPDLRCLLVSSYLDKYAILSLRHVNQYFYTLQLPLSVSPPRLYATCVAFHRMWENEALARHKSACAALALPGPGELPEGLNQQLRRSMQISIDQIG
jgi:hypothetical protein